MSESSTPIAMAVWYCVLDGTPQGPAAETEMLAWVREGRLGPDDLVWNSAMGTTWVPAGTVEVLGFPRRDTGIIGVGGVAHENRFYSPTRNGDLIRQARARLRGHWGTVVGAWGVRCLFLLDAYVLPVVGPLAIMGPLWIGTAMLFLALDRGQPASPALIWRGFKSFGKTLRAYLLIVVLVSAWSLLLLVPGIMAACSYAMTFYIMLDNPDMGALEAVRLSKQAMRGNRWKYFCLRCRFAGWMVIGVLTLGVGFLWLGPYMEATRARFYEDLRPCAPE